ncbi:FmdB family zinc ribbon protein [Hydromonas duriensis]|uniref:Putative FmdB family regulatory protein n=1 Tax=Hydromonas duriensis TaxID=1527608 RepID=A0A4R6Y8I6_9BURK|nr:FmdB family zinc ribbon protein [Hydromonas duriensis]TDR31698.1 putative FmdB family regulatory protein [Hydromonas duriensis]
MPIYAYHCSHCGHAKDVLQKMSDAPLTTCPNCGQDSFSKQITAAGFQLKGSGWYVTDFRGGSSTAGNSTSSSVGGETAVSNSSGTTSVSDSTASPTPAACATGCGCH